MYRGSILHVSSWGRLALGLCLLVGLCLALGGQARPAHAQAILTVTNCSNDSQLQADVSTANSDNAGDTITFSCSGDILLTSTLTISGSMTLDGSGQSVTLDGGNSVQVLSVNSGVSLTLNALTIFHGRASNGGGGLLNVGTVSISNSTFANNSAPGAGGGLYNQGGTLSISNSTFANNSSTLSGGGLFNGHGTLSISNSTFANNSANVGGGLFNEGTVSISNSTFANNSATHGAAGGGFGGGLANIGGGTVSISNSTFANNSAIGGGGFGSFGVGLYNQGTVSISNSIVAHNSAGFEGNCYGGVSDQGYNLESGTDCGFTGTGSLRNTDPKLASTLASNGGPTQTLALLDGSPAIDRIPAARCPATDQRGATRPDAGETTCDIGAYESNYPPDSDLGLTNMPANITTNATSPQGAVVHYTPPTATDESGDSSTASVSCTPASGSTFAIGTTTVTCTATDSDDTNSPVSQSFTVTVNDTDLGLTKLPANLTVNATSPQGATVTYTSPTVVDEDSSLPQVNCTPASGSTFAIGTTTVTCTVSDSNDAPSSVSQTFTVTVKGAAAQVSDLISLVNSFNLPPDFQASFDTQLQAVQADLAANNTAQACQDLTAFSNHAQAQSGKGLTVSQANQLIAAAKQIQAVLGC